MTAYNFTNLQQVSPYIPGQTITVGAYYTLGGVLANGDTITATGLIPPSGIQALEVKVIMSQLDTNAAPTATFSLGDSLTDGNAAARYCLLSKMGTNQSGYNVIQYSNVTPTITNGAYVKGVGYFYADDENTAGTNNGYLNLVMTVTNNFATASATGNIFVYFTYRCVGNI